MARRTDTHIWDQNPTSIQSQLEDLARREQALTLAIAARGETRQRANRPGQDLDAQLAEVREEAAALRARDGQSKVILHLRELPRRDYRNLLVAHPPRDGDDQDARTNFNGDTFPGALIRAVVTDAEDYRTGDPVPLDMDAWLADDDNPQAMGNADFFDVFRKAHNLHHTPTPQDPPTRAA